MVHHFIYFFFLGGGGGDGAGKERGEGSGVLLFFKGVGNLTYQLFLWGNQWMLRTSGYDKKK